MAITYDPRYPKPIADNTLVKDPVLRNQMQALGWENHDVMISTHKGLVKAPFTIFQRVIKNPVKNTQNNKRFFPKTRFGKKTLNEQNPQQTQPGGLTTGRFLGVNSAMGVAHSNFDPDPTKNLFASIPSVMLMRSENDTFVIGFDSEFYYDDENRRHILSWQFAFVDPSYPDDVVELLVWADDEKTLSLSLILNFIVEEWNIGQKIGDWDDCDGIPYRSTRRWTVPVLRNNHFIGKTFADFQQALSACEDPDFKKAMQSYGEKYKCRYEYVDRANNDSVKTPKVVVNGFGIGYDNDYKYANQFALPITLVCSTGDADLKTLNVDSVYEKDLMTKVASVQGGLVTLKDFYLHNPQNTKFWNLYPLKVTIRDTMCFAPAGQKSVFSLGESIGVPKVELPDGYTKDNMLHFLKSDLHDYTEYACTDSLITLLYSSELFGYNKEMPVTVTSASAKVAVPVIQDYFGLDRSDVKGFDRVFRGLHKVNKGLSVFKGSKSGYIANTNYEPVSDDARLLQDYAANAYKGGFNACFRPGYYKNLTHDFDLENAYPTCMACTPDVSWDNPLMSEITNQYLTSMMVRTPFDPVFAYVTFEFPETVKVPCIPVTVEGSLIYPRTSGDLDGVYVSAPELWLALRLNAKVFVKRMYIGNIKSDENGNGSHSLLQVVKQFVNDRSVAKQIFGKGSLIEQLLKTGGNGLYGKTAQDVIDKHTWSAMHEDMENIGGSAITSPVHACLITAGVRAVLIAAINQLEDLGYEVYSVTTDGFITDAAFDILNDLDLYGLSKYFRNARVAITGSSEMWSEKHNQTDLLNLTTRGNVSEKTGDPENNILPGVCAHNSFVTPYESDSLADRHYFKYESFMRTDRLHTTGIRFESFKNESKRINRRDFNVKELERWISMDYDLKRKPLASTMRDVYEYFVEEEEVGWIANFDTTPYESPDEYLFYKTIGRSCKVLATCDDWRLFFDKVTAKKDGIRRNIKDLKWSIIFSCIMSYRLGIPLTFLHGLKADIPCLDESSPWSVEEKCEWINQFNGSKKKFTINAWKNCRKSDRISQIVSEDLFMDVMLLMMQQSPSADELKNKPTKE